VKVNLFDAPVFTPLYVVTRSTCWASVVSIIVVDWPGTNGGHRYVWGYSSPQNRHPYSNIGAQVDRFMDDNEGAEVFDSYEEVCDSLRKKLVPPPQLIAELDAKRAATITTEHGGAVGGSTMPINDIEGAHHAD